MPFVYFKTLFVLFYIYMLRKRHINDIIPLSEVKIKWKIWETELNDYVLKTI